MLTSLSYGYIVHIICLYFSFLVIIQPVVNEKDGYFNESKAMKEKFADFSVLFYLSYLIFLFCLFCKGLNPYVDSP